MVASPRLLKTSTLEDSPSLISLSLLQNPFGAAKPREAVLATRVGKKEEDILKEEVLKEKLAVSPSLCQESPCPTCAASWQAA